MQRFGSAQYPVHMLDTQYRMHPLIAGFPSEYFYNGRLRTSPSINPAGSHYRPYHADATGYFRPLVFHDVVKGVQSYEGVSLRNVEEVSILFVHIYLTVMT